MKILIYDARPDEQEDIKTFDAHNNVQVDTTKEPLNLDTVDKLKGYDGVSTDSISNEPKFYQKLNQLGINHVAIRHTGYEFVDLNEASKNNIIITNVPAYSPRSVSELTLTQVMYLLRKIGYAKSNEDKNNFQWAGLEAPEIHNLTVGIIGTGHIGSASAKIFHALGAEVLANDPVHNPDLEDIVTYVTRDQLLQESDIITVHTPLKDDTKNLINKEAFTKMNNNAIFINDARGGIVNTNALIDALENHEIAGAGLDTIDGEDGVFNVDLSSQKLEDERIKKLLKMPNVIMTPHIGFYTNVSVKNIINISLGDIISAKNGKVNNQVN